MHAKQRIGFLTNSFFNSKQLTSIHSVLINDILIFASIKGAIFCFLSPLSVRKRQWFSNQLDERSFPLNHKFFENEIRGISHEYIETIVKKLLRLVYKNHQLEKSKGVTRIAGSVF